MPKQELSEQEWSHFFDIHDLRDDLTKVTIEASEEERQDMARRLAVLEIKSAKADLVLEREQGGRTIRVKGQFEAKIIQNCVVTLDDFETILNEPIEGWFADKEATVSFAAAKREKEAAVSRGEVEMVEEAEDPESIIDGAIDLGELVTQHISLAIPPYPHKEGVSYEYGDENVQIDDKSPLRKNPFEALKDWKEKR
jgi:uncharacterized metal-binding protein YceD (DUF177 family)